MQTADWFGIATVVLVLATAAVPYLNKKYKTDIKWHFALAKVTAFVGVAYLVLVLRALIRG